MIRRLLQILSGTGELVRAESELTLTKARAMITQLLLISALGLLAMLALVGLLAALAAALSERVGWVGAIALVCGGVLVVLGVSVIVFSTSVHTRLRRSRKRARIAKQHIAGDRVPESLPPAPRPERPSQARSPHIMTNTNQAPGTNTAGSEKDPTSDSLGMRAAAYVVQNPGQVASGVFAVVALLGPGRAIRLTSRGLMLASLASKLGNGELLPDKPNGTPDDHNVPADSAESSLNHAPEAPAAAGRQSRKPQRSAPTQRPTTAPP